MDSYPQGHEQERELRNFLGSLVDRSLRCLSALRPYARRAQQAEYDVLYQEGVALVHDITYDATQDLPELHARIDIWTGKISDWVVAVSATVRGLWSKARTHFSLHRPAEDPTGPPQPDDPIMAEVQVLKTEVETIKRTIADLTIEMRTGFQRIDARFQQVDERFQQVDDNFAEVRQELHKAQLHREHIMTDRRQGERLEERLFGSVRRTVDRTLRPLFGANIDVHVLWTEGDTKRRWYRLENELHLSAGALSQRIDHLLEIEWPTSPQARTFLVCEATLTLDREHIEKLSDTCQEFKAAGHRVIGILGYVKALVHNLDRARMTDLVLWRFTDDMKSYTAEMTGAALDARLRILAAEVASSPIALV